MDFKNSPHKWWHVNIHLISVVVLRTSMDALNMHHYGLSPVLIVCTSTWFVLFLLLYCSYFVLYLCLIDSTTNSLASKDHPNSSEFCHIIVWFIFVLYKLGTSHQDLCGLEYLIIYFSTMFIILFVFNVVWFLIVGNR